MENMKYFCRSICLFALYFLFVSVNSSAEIKTRAVEKTDIKKIEPVTKEEIIKTIERSTNTVTGELDQGLLSKLIGKMAINTKWGPLVLFPVADSNKDLGPSYGVMPVMAIKRKQEGQIKSVIVPSITYNHNVGGTFTYRQYFFPDEKRYLILRASKSVKVEEEYMAYYYTPDLFSSGIRFSFEPKHWVSGKPSFYGIGIDTKSSARANYALDITGEETIIDFPIFKPFYINLTNSLFLNKVVPGPVNSGELKRLYPQFYDIAKRDSLFHLNRLALVYDDTDHLYLPTIGTYATASVTYSNKALGSDYEYRTYAFQLKQYYNYKEEGKFITAIHYLLQYQRGEDLPFYAMIKMGESTGLRSVGDGRYTDRGKFLLTFEERISLSRTPFLNFINEIEIAPFLDIGTVFDKPSNFSRKKLRYAPGISARLVIRPQLVGTVEFAFGNEGANAIVRVGYPF